MVNLAELTYHLDLADHEQWVAASFAGSQGPWSEAEARVLVEVWHGNLMTAFSGAIVNRLAVDTYNEAYRKAGDRASALALLHEEASAHQ